MEKNTQVEIDWEKVMVSAKKAVNIIISINSNNAVKDYIRGKDYNEILNEVIVCSLSESPPSSRKMFEVDSDETAKNRYIRMGHDFTKKCNRLKNGRIYKNPFRQSYDLMNFFWEQYQEDPKCDFVRRTWLFKRTLSGKDFDIFDALLNRQEIDRYKIANKYGVSPESVVRAKNRLMRRYKDYLGLIRYYETSYIEDMHEGEIRKDMRDE